MKYLQFNVIESCPAMAEHYYTARIWWLTNDGAIAATEKQFGSEKDGWKWIETELKKLI